MSADECHFLVGYGPLRGSPVSLYYVAPDLGICHSSVNTQIPALFLGHSGWLNAWYSGVYTNGMYIIKYYSLRDFQQFQEFSSISCLKKSGYYWIFIETTIQNSITFAG
jgi:hypothetical protein